MKKLMFICSLAFTFLLGVSDVSAQYVPTEQAIAIVKTEISQTQQSVPVSTTLGTAPVASTSIDSKLKKGFLGLVLESLTATADADVQESIDEAHETLSAHLNGNATRIAALTLVKTFTEELLAD